MKKTISQLQIIEVQYRGGQFILGKAVPLQVYRDSKIYNSAGLPFEIVQPKIPGNKISRNEIENIGVLGGLIAEAVSDARKGSKAILMTGGNCCHITGIIGGLQDAHGPETRIGLVWFDAHGDINTEKTSISGMLGGMPVAVAAGLTHPTWRELSHITAPLPTDRILLVDVRNLDPAKQLLIDATEVVIASPAPGFPGKDLQSAVRKLTSKCDMIYLHIDSDILDEAYTPNHKTKEPNGPDMDQVKSAIDIVMATGIVSVYAVVSVYGEGKGAEIMIESGKELIRHGLKSWKRYGYN